MPVLVVQKGHCYRTTGSTGTTGEQDYATAVADACVRLLNGKSGWSVRVILADSGSYSGDAFAAIHCDGSTNNTARGSSTGYQSERGRQFAEAWMNAYAARGWTGGFRPPNYTDALAGYYGVRNAINAGNDRAVILECGFMTNAQDKQLMTGPGGVDRVALAIGDALGIATEDGNVVELTGGSADMLGDIQLRVASMHAGQFLPWPSPQNAPGGDLSWFQTQSAIALAPLTAMTAEILAEQSDDLTAEGVMARLTAHLDAEMVKIREQHTAEVNALRVQLEQARTEDLQAMESVIRETLPDDLAEQVVDAMGERFQRTQ